MDENEIYKRKTRSHIKSLKTKNFTLGGSNPLFIIAGPCLVEDIGICTEIISELKNVCEQNSVQYIFKASYDKANKTIKDAYRGPGWKNGLKMLEKIKGETGVPILTDVHEKQQCAPVAEVADILQIPALLSKQIDLILEAARTHNIINIKKGQFTPPWEINNIVTRLKSDGFENICFTDRGYMFGYGNLISDMRALQIMSMFGCPIIYDGSHSVHGNDIIITGTDLEHRDFIGPLILSAVANGVDGIFLEVHPEPEKALSDSLGTFPLENVGRLIADIVAIDKVLNR